MKAWRCMYSQGLKPFLGSLFFPLLSGALQSLLKEFLSPHKDMRSAIVKFS